MAKYYEKVDLKAKTKINEILSELPQFVTLYYYDLATDVAAQTSLAYIMDINILLKWYAEKLEINLIDISLDDIKNISVNTINEYKVYLSVNTDRQNKEAAIARKIVSLNSFFDFLYRSDAIDGNPCRKLRPNKKGKKSVPIVRLQPNETVSFINSVTPHNNNVSEHQNAYIKKTEDRDTAILTVLLGTGIRVSELVGLDLEDILFEELKILVHRKGNKEQYVAMSDEVEEALKIYVEKRQSIVPSPGHESALFLSTQKKRMCVKAVENLVKKYSNIAGIEKNITPHKLRKTYGTELYEQTGDIYLVARALGHNSVNTTKDHYILNDENSLLDARNKVIISTEPKKKE